MSLSTKVLYENFMGAVVSAPQDAAKAPHKAPEAPVSYGATDQGVWASLGLCFAAMACFVASGIPEWQIVASVCGLAAALPPVLSEGRCEKNLLSLSRQATQETGENAFTAVVAAQDVVKPEARTAGLATGYAEQLEKLAAKEITGAVCKIGFAGASAALGLGLMHYIMGGVFPHTQQDVRLGFVGAAFMTLAIVTNNVLSWARYNTAASRWRAVQKGTRRLVSFQPK